MSTEVYEKILEYQNGDKEAAWALVKKFTPLLKHYAYLAQDEDSFEDFQCALLTFLKNLQLLNLSSCEDGALIQYICVAVRHEYINRSKKRAKDKKIDYIEDLSFFSTADFNRKASQIDPHESLLLEDMRTILTPHEYNVLVSFYFNHCSISEIATRMRKTRQAINQTKKHALLKLKKAWT